MSDVENKKTDIFGDLLLLRRLWPFLRKDWMFFLYAMLISPIIAVAGLAQPYLIKLAIDDHIAIDQLDGLTSIAVYYLICSIGVYVLSASYTIAVSWGGQRMLLRMRQYLYNRVLSLPLSYFDKRPAGVLLTRLTNDVNSLGESIGAGVVTIALDLLMIFGCLGMMFYLDTTLTIIMLLCSPILMVILEWLRRKLKDLFLRIRNAISQVNANLAEYVDGVEILQLFAAEKRAKKEFDKANSEFRNACSLSNIYDSVMFAIVDGMGSVFIALLLWYGSGLMVKSGLPVPEIEPRSAGVMIAFIDYLNRLLGPIRDLSSKIAIIQRALAALTKIFGLVDAQEPMDKSGNDIDQVHGKIEVSNLSFRYAADGPEILKNISFDVAPQEVIAIVGSSGSGKTTLTRLLDRSYVGYEGSIKLDGQELSSISIDSLRQRVAAVRQDIQIFSSSIAFNVTLDNPLIPLSSRNQAAEMTHAMRFVDRLGWEHALRERGADISVGEGQLLIFARTMAHDPDLIMLDEATASVDTITEALIQDAIARMLEQKTVIVIAHRLSTIQKADRIIVLEKGSIVEMGNHHELLDLKGRYAQLLEAGQDAIKAS